MICAIRDSSCQRQHGLIAGLLTCPSAVRACRTIPALFIREGLMAFAFLAHDNYDSPRQPTITRVTNTFINERKRFGIFRHEPVYAGFADYSGTARLRARALSK